MQRREECDGIFTLIAMPGMIFGGVVSGFFQRIAQGGDRSLEARFIVLFFNVAVVACARIRLEGGDPTTADGFRAARENLRHGVPWEEWEPGCIASGLEKRYAPGIRRFRSIE